MGLHERYSWYSRFVCHLCQICQDMTQQLCRELVSGRFSSVPDTKLRAASQVLNGRLDRHPAIHGLIIAILEKCRIADAGLSTLRGTRLSQAEEALVQEAGATLALMGFNKAALKFFGVAHRAAPLPLEKYHALGLPDPCFSLEAACQRTNFALLDDLLSKHPAAPSRRLVLSFDKTYLQSGLNVLSTQLLAYTYDIYDIYDDYDDYDDYDAYDAYDAYVAYDAFVRCASQQCSHKKDRTSSKWCKNTDNTGYIYIYVDIEAMMRWWDCKRCKCKFHMFHISKK